MGTNSELPERATHLTPGQVASLAIVLGSGLVPIAWLAWFTWHDFPRSLLIAHQLVVRDYLNTWAGGYLASHGRIGVVFQPEQYASWLRDIFGPRLDLHTFSYPPHLLLLAVPLAALGLVPGYFVWVIATSGLMWVVLRAGSLTRWATVAVVCSPAALESVLLGQNGALISGAALSGGMLLAERAPILSGSLLGLLTLKPQLGLLVPICLLANRQIGALIAGALFGLGYLLMGLAIFGMTPWFDYMTQTVPYMRRYLDAPFGLAAHYIMVPPFITARAIGIGVQMSYALQAVATITCIAVIGWVWTRKNCERRAAVALTLCLAPVATPYSHAYDMVCVAVACAILIDMELAKGRISGPAWLCLAPAWIWPGIALFFGALVCPGLGAPVTALAACFAFSRLFERGEPIMG